LDRQIARGSTRICIKVTGNYKFVHPISLLVTTKISLFPRIWNEIPGQDLENNNHAHRENEVCKEDV
jgi:hypothetical protein